MTDSTVFSRLRDSVVQQFPSSRPPAAVQVCHAPTVAEWRAKHKAEIEQALAEQRKMLLQKRQELLDWDVPARTKFMVAFGLSSGTDANRAAMADRIDRELALNSKMTVDNFVPAPGGDFAFVYPTDTSHTVNVEQRFWTAPMSGPDSKAGILCHEMSHFTDIGDTSDKFVDYLNNAAVYGQYKSLTLAETRPDLALQHADSFEYWCEGAYDVH